MLQGKAQTAVHALPSETSSHLILAKVFQRSGGPPDAIREARVAADLDLAFSAVRYTLFTLYREAGDPQASLLEMETFQQLKTLDGPD